MSYNLYLSSPTMLAGIYVTKLCLLSGAFMAARYWCCTCATTGLSIPLSSAHKARNNITDKNETGLPSEGFATSISRANGVIHLHSSTTLSSEGIGNSITKKGILHIYRNTPFPHNNVQIPENKTLIQVIVFRTFFKKFNKILCSKSNRILLVLSYSLIRDCSKLI